MRYFQSYKMAQTLNVEISEEMLKLFAEMGGMPLHFKNLSYSQWSSIDVFANEFACNIRDPEAQTKFFTNVGGYNLVLAFPRWVFVLDLDTIETKEYSCVAWKGQKPSDAVIEKLRAEFPESWV